MSVATAVWKPTASRPRSSPPPPENRLKIVGESLMRARFVVFATLTYRFPDSSDCSTARRLSDFLMVGLCVFSDIELPLKGDHRRSVCVNHNPTLKLESTILPRYRRTVVMPVQMVMVFVVIAQCSNQTPETFAISHDPHSAVPS